MSQIHYEFADGLSVITLANPPQNRITPQMSTEFGQALHSVSADQPRAVLIRADGPDFSFGGDIGTWPELDPTELRGMFEHHLQVFNAFEALAVPTIVSVQGLCFGGGLELAARADMIIAGESARFGHPEQTLGIITLLGGAYRVAAKAGRAKAMEWALTSEQVPAREMERHGVVSRVVPDDRLQEESLLFARRVARGPTRAHVAHKALLKLWEAEGTAAADRQVLDMTMDVFASADVQMAIHEAVTALKAGRKRPEFDFQGR